MGLVDYSDSDASDTEAHPVSKVAPLSTKSAFQKVVDRSNPGKIRVTLPGSVTPAVDGDEPTAKRVKTGGGAFGGLNSFLPAPKRTGLTASSGLGSGNATGRSGLAVGVSLKTGAEPGFSRDVSDIMGEGYSESITNPNEGLSLPPYKAAVESTQTPAEDVELVGKPMMFKPLSVSRKSAKKKNQPLKTEAKVVPTVQETSSTLQAAKVLKPKSTVSLFSVAAEPMDAYEAASGDEYKPMIHSADKNIEEAEMQDDISKYQSELYSSAPPPRPIVPAPAAAQGAQSLTDVASDLGLSVADRRQLFGRQKGSKNAPIAQKVINFNTDQEYQHNNDLRAQGETVSHNPVKSIAPGKHNLKQLLNAAQSQKEALEESFAKGRSNRAEASSRYGW